MTSPVAQMVKRLPTCRRPGFDPWVGKILWRRKWQPTPVLLPGKSHGWRSVVGPRGHKESDTTEQLHFIYFFNWLLTIERFYQTYSHNIHFKITGFRRFLRRNMALSRIYCCYIIISIEFKEKHTLEQMSCFVV